MKAIETKILLGDSKEVLKQELKDWERKFGTGKKSIDLVLSKYI